MKWVAPALIFAAGISIGSISYPLLQSETNAISFREKRAGNYQFINPLLECEIAESLITNAVQPFRNKLEEFIETAKEKNRASVISVYFRDLNNGPWIGINEKETFSPASLLKVPIMMSVLKTAEDDPTFLKKELPHKGPDENEGKLIQSNQHMKIGASYTIEELVVWMIKYSDNNAKSLLLDSFNINILEEIFKEVGVEEPTIERTDNFITVKNYAGFFRILFNASLLNKTSSEKALLILSDLEFKDGLVAGVPGNITVAHKFGERTLSGSIQLHDCGIIYYPKQPYLLCVMTRGKDVSALIKVIADISKLVYQEVDWQQNK